VRLCLWLILSHLKSDMRLSVFIQGKVDDIPDLTSQSLPLLFLQSHSRRLPGYSPIPFCHIPLFPFLLLLPTPLVNFNLRTL
jgi:hypothetical protein